jgi:hypothetical protein
MKIIITEEQYNELNKVDDVYDGLNTYYRRRINFIDIKSNIDRRIENTTSKYLKLNLRGFIGRVNDIIIGTVWETIPNDWYSLEDERANDYVNEMIDRVKKKYGNYIKEKLNKILEDENNNN